MAAQVEACCGTWLVGLPFLDLERWMKHKAKVYRRYFSLTFPNGTTRKEVLPSVKGFKLGMLVRTHVIYGGTFAIAWWRRVKGGWEFVKSGEVRDVQQR